MKPNGHPDTCSCCEGIEVLTPLPVFNRPGLPALLYRIGTHATFLKSMLARLSSLYLEIDDNGAPLPWEGGSGSVCNPGSPPPVEDPCAPGSQQRLYPLRQLTTRRSDDPSIALLDAWALVADVLTFYQARIANEGYLRTAVERRSVQELARLVGYKLRPGVSASVYLAFELDRNYQVEIPPGTRAQSVPKPGEMPQAFETMEPFPARYAWNAIATRSQRPQYISLGNVSEIDRVYLQGLSTQLRPNDPLLFVFGAAQGAQASRFVQKVEGVPVIEPVPGAGYTIVDLQPQAALVFAQQIGARYLKLGDFGVNADPQTVQNLLPPLQTLAQVRSRGELEQVLPDALRLAKIHPFGAGDHLLKWLNSLESDLQKLSVQTSQAAAPVPVLAASKSPFPFLAQVDAQVKEPAQRFASGKDLPRSPIAILSPGADTIPSMLTTLLPRAAKTLYAAWGSAQSTPNAPLQQIAALRVKAAPFGHNASFMPIQDDKGAFIGETEWPLAESTLMQVTLPVVAEIPVVNLLANILDAHRQASILVKAGGHTYYRTLSVEDNNQLNLPPGSVTVEQVGDQTVNFDFDMQGTRHLIQFDQNNGSVRISVDEQEVADLTQGQSTVVELAAGHRVSVFYNQSGVSVADETLAPPDPQNVIVLDAAYDQILPESWVLIDRPIWPQPRAFQVLRVETISMTAYRLSGKATRLTLSGDWLTNQDLLLADIRSTTVFAQSEPLTLVDERYDDPVQGDTIELDSLYDGLDSGRWIFIRGERSDIPGASGVEGVELAMIANVIQTVQQITVTGANGDPMQIPRPDDKVHTVLELAQPLDNSYVRKTVKVYANVTKATHGETRREVLGSGDARKAFQAFQLRQNPLTYLPAPIPAGAASTLEVRVNNVRWPEVENLLALDARQRGYTLRRDDDGQKDLTTTVFGDGRQHGARLPSGTENIEAVYRSGIGKVGNVAAEAIQLLITRPLGVKGVNNPQRASGGADRDDRDAARRNAPLAVMALDRLVSTQDYEDFARMFAGVGKASAGVFPQARGKMVHVTIAGAGNIPIDRNSELYRNLNLAMRRYGDPSQPFRIDVRELLLLLVSAKVRLQPDYRWVSVEPEIRHALLKKFGFDQRELGDDVYASDIIACIQQVRGVAFVDLDFLESLSEEEVQDSDQLLAKLPTVPPDRPKKGIDVQYARRGDRNEIRPAQLAILSSEVPDTLILTELP